MAALFTLPGWPISSARRYAAARRRGRGTGLMRPEFWWMAAVSAIVVIVAAAYTMRYEFLTVEKGPGLWRRDRFTGEIVYCRPTKGYNNTVTARCPSANELKPPDFSS